MDKEKIKETIVSQKKLFLDKKGLFKRDILRCFYDKYNQVKEVLIITGIRRCGKSSLMRLVWDEFRRKESLTEDQFLYVNFEDERIAGFGKDDFERLLEAYYELNNPSKGKRIFIFLDEIQNVPFWEKWINRIYEENKYKIFITGSNATLLSSELSTALTGRNIAITLYPLSFYEYVIFFKGQKISAVSFYDQEEKIKIRKNLEEYLLFGGMPEYIKTHSIELIQEYFRDIILRDIVNRYRVKYKQGLKELAHLLLSNLGQIQSLKNISGSIEIKNINTVKNYLKYLEESFLFFKLPIFSYSYKKQVYNPDKFYVADVAFFNNIAFRTSDNLGVLYENIVFSELKRDPEKEVFYCKTKKSFEVDFAIKRKNRVEQLIQVSYDLAGGRTLEREERALLAAMDELNLKRGIILNKELEKVEKKDGKEIQYLPLWKWLLSEK